MFSPDRVVAGASGYDGTMAAKVTNSGDKAPSPFELRASTLNLYSSPVVRPVFVYEVPVIPEAVSSNCELTELNM